MRVVSGDDEPMLVVPCDDIGYGVDVDKRIVSGYDEPLLGRICDDVDALFLERECSFVTVSVCVVSVNKVASISVTTVGISGVNDNGILVSWIGSVVSVSLVVSVVLKE